MGQLMSFDGAQIQTEDGAPHFIEWFKNEVTRWLASQGTQSIQIEILDKSPVTTSEAIGVE